MSSLLSGQIKLANVLNLIAGFFTITYAGGVKRRIVIRHSDAKFFKFFPTGTMLFGFALSNEYRPDEIADEKRFKYCGKIVGNNITFFNTFKTQLIAEVGHEAAEAKMRNLVNALHIINETWDVQTPPQDKAFAVKNDRCVRCGQPLTDPETIRKFQGYGKTCFERIMGF